MSTSTKEDQELEEIERAARESSPEDLKTERGYEAFRERMREAAERKKQVTIRLDADIVAAFKELAGPDGSYQTLINRALHDWLEARSVRGLVEEAVEDIVDRLTEGESGGQPRG
jgi:uncharacterized protein (DUF4415 family)